MRRILSIIVVLFCLVVVTVGIVSYYYGAEAEKYYAELQQEASRSGYATLTTESYTRSLFTSIVRTGVEIRQPGKIGRKTEDAKGSDVLRFTLESEIRHGPLPPMKLPDGRWEWKPVLAVIQTKMTPPADGKDGLSELFRKIPELAAATNCITIGLRGESEGTLTVPAFRHTLPDDVNVRLDGFFMHYTLTANLKGGKSNLTAPLLEIGGKDGSLSVKGIEASSSLREGTSPLSVGEALFRIARIEFSSKEDGQSKDFSVENIELKASDREVGETIDFLFQMKVEKAGANRAHYGPAELDMEFRKLDIASLLKMQEFARQTGRQPASGSDDIFDALAVARYTSILGAMLKKSPEIEIGKLTFATGEGTFSGKLKIAFDGSVTPSLENPLLLLAALSAQAEVNVKEKLLEQIVAAIVKSDIEPEGGDQSEADLQKLAADKTRVILNDLLKDRLMVKENDSYKASADYHQGKLTVNGQKIPLQDLFESPARDHRNESSLPGQ